MATLQQSHTTFRTDTEILFAIRSGSRSAFSQLYSLYSKDLYRYGYHMVQDKTVVEDVMHDVFVNLWTRKDQLPEVQSIKAYLMTCLRNGILKKLTHEKRLFDHYYEWAHEMIQNQSDEAIEQEREMVKQIREVINLLSDRQREVIYLRFYQNLSYSEISTLLDMDSRNAYNLASKAYSFIKDHLQRPVNTSGEMSSH